MSEKKNTKLYYDKTFPSVVYGVNEDGTYTIRWYFNKVEERLVVTKE